MAKEIMYRVQTRNKMLAGVDRLINTVKLTLGPHGRYVALEKAGSSPLITNDGARIAKEIVFGDRFEAMGAALLKEVAAKTNDGAGDGTTTAMLLSGRIIHGGFQLLAAGANPIAVKRGILGASYLAGTLLAKLAKPVQSNEELAQIATISAKDELIGRLIAEALDKVGTNGVITIEESNSWETELEVAEGMQFKRGYLTPHMATNKQNMTAELKNPCILVTDHTITSPHELVPFMDCAAKESRPLLIIAEGVEGAALGTLIMNTQKGVIQAVAVHPPAYGEGRRAQMDDIALWTGATYISKERGISLREATTDMLGSAASVFVDKNNTVILTGDGNAEAVSNRIASLRALIEKTEHDFPRKQLEERLARLVSGAAVLKIGGATEAEMQERKLRCEDALNAARCALEGGIVPGGGLAYLNIKPAIAAYSETLPEDERDGAVALLQALDIPTWQIAENAGSSGAKVLAELSQKSRGVGYNAATGEYTDMFAAGIIDSAKVAQLALQSAASIAAVLLTTEVSIATAEKGYVS